jgi:hypothetical protein
MITNIYHPFAFENHTQFYNGNPLPQLVAESNSTRFVTLAGMRDLQSGLETQQCIFQKIKQPLGRKRGFPHRSILVFILYDIQANISLFVTLFCIFFALHQLQMNLTANQLQFFF